MTILLDDISHQKLLFPFGEVQSIVYIRLGILTIFEKWNAFFPGKVMLLSEVKNQNSGLQDFHTFQAHIVPSLSFLKQLSQQKILTGLSENSRAIYHPWHLSINNDWAISEDFELLTNGRISQKIPKNCSAIKPENIFIEEGAKINFTILNAENGPIYIGKNAQILEGSMLRGPLSVGEGSLVKMGTKIYGATTIGPFSIVGGEIKNSILMGFSNKAHDGYLGDSVIGEWCNLGAGTSNSNIKNNASSVKVWIREKSDFEIAGNKCGLFMGNYSRCAINTSFNTGTVVGVCCNIFGNANPSKFIDNFSWGKEKYTFEKAIADIRNWKKLKERELTEKEINSLKKIY